MKFFFCAVAVEASHRRKEKGFGNFHIMFSVADDHMGAGMIFFDLFIKLCFGNDRKIFDTVERFKIPVQMKYFAVSFHIAVLAVA